MNPYASFLGDRNALEVIEQTPGILSGLAVQLGRASMEWRPAPGKWNAREILCHLADCEIAFAFRFRQTLAEDHHVIQPFDQERWAGMYGSLGARSALNAFSALREWNLALIGIDAARGDVQARHASRTRRDDVSHVVETMAGHDLNHLAQLDRIVAGFAPA